MQGTVHTRDSSHQGQFTPGTGNSAGDSSHQGQGTVQGTVHTRDRGQFTPGTVHTRDRGQCRGQFTPGTGNSAGDSSHQEQLTPGTGNNAGDSSHQGQGAGQETVHTRDSSGTRSRTWDSSHQGLFTPGIVHTKDREQGWGQFTPGTGSMAGDSSHQHSNSLCTHIYLQLHHFSTAVLTPHCYSKHQPLPHTAKHQPLPHTAVLNTSPY